MKRRSIRGTFRRSALALGTAAMAACNLDIEAPSLVAGEGLATPANVGVIMAGVQADFECALAHYIVSTALFGSELAIGSVFQNIKEIDKRDLSPLSSTYTSLTCSGAVEGNPGLYRPLATARWQADNALKVLEGFADADVLNRQQLLATSAAYAGYSLVLMGEGMCSSAIDVGPELSPTQLFQEADARFTRGIAAAQAISNADLLNWNLVGRARTRHRLKNLSAAASDAAAVPLTYVKLATYSADSPRRENIVWVHGQRSRIVTVDPTFRNLTVGGLPDPRVPVVDARVNAADAVTPLWTTSKYAGNTASIPIATGVEARLIAGEAAGGQAAVAAINQLRARFSLPSFASTDAAAIQAQVIEERRREFFLDGHHLGDARHYGTPLLPAAGSPIPPLYGSGSYGAATCFALPDVERVNNPNM